MPDCKSCYDLVCSDESCAACRGGIRTLMITSDYQHTALAVAKDVGMIRPDAQMVVIDTRLSHSESQRPIPGMPLRRCHVLAVLPDCPVLMAIPGMPLLRCHIIAVLPGCPVLTGIPGVATPMGTALMASDSATAQSLVRRVLALKKRACSQSRALPVGNSRTASLLVEHAQDWCLGSRTAGHPVYC